MNIPSIKPYLIRATCEWCADNGFTPYISAVAEGCSGIPERFIKDGEIMLNISHQATGDLLINNEVLQFSTRFGGMPVKVEVMIEAVKAIFAKESGQGLVFTPDKDTIVELEKYTTIDNSDFIGDSTSSVDAGRNRPFLKIVK